MDTLIKSFKDYTLAIPGVIEMVNRGDFYRASGDCICPECGEKYSKHKNVVSFEWLTVLCSNDLVKL